MNTEGASMSELMRDIENLVPLPQGRNVSMAASAVKCQPESEEMRKFERQLDSHIDSPRSRALVWLKYLDWFDQVHSNRGSDSSNLYKRAFNDVMSRPSADCGVEIVTIAFRYAITLPKPRTVFDDLYSKRKCVKVSLFWVKWAQLVEQSGDIGHARKVFEKALALPLENKESVENAFKSFQERVCCEAMQNMGEEQSTEEDSQRMPLESLASETRLPVDRQSSTVQSGIKHKAVSSREQDQVQLSKFSIKKDRPESLALTEGSLGITRKGKISLNAEKENENPKSCWKSQVLNRQSNSSVAISSEKVEIPNDDDKVLSLQDVCEEIADLRVEMTRNRQLFLDRDNETKLLLSKILKQLETCSCGRPLNNSENDDEKNAESMARSEQSTLGTKASDGFATPSVSGRKKRPDPFTPYNTPHGRGGDVTDLNMSGIKHLEPIGEDDDDNGSYNDVTEVASSV